MSEDCKHPFTHDSVNDNRNGTETVYVYCNECNALLDMYTRVGGFFS